MSNKMFGQVRVIKEEKGYGYIEAENEDMIFFYLGSVLHGIVPTIGCDVQFHLIDNKKGMRATAITVLSEHKVPRKPTYTQEGFNALSEIANWKLEAKFDNSQRYFFVIPEIETISKNPKGRVPRVLPVGE